MQEISGQEDICSRATIIIDLWKLVFVFRSLYSSKKSYLNTYRYDVAQNMKAKWNSDKCVCSVCSRIYDILNLCTVYILAGTRLHAIFKNEWSLGNNAFILARRDVDDLLDIRFYQPIWKILFVVLCFQMPELCLAINELSSHPHNLLWLVQLVPNWTSRGRYWKVRIKHWEKCIMFILMKYF